MHGYIIFVCEYKWEIRYAKLIELKDEEIPS